MATTSIFDGSATDEIGTDLIGDVLLVRVKSGSTVVDSFDPRLNEVGTEDNISINWTLGSSASIIAIISIDSEVYISDHRESNIITYDNDGSERPITGLSIIGEGEGDNQIYLYMHNTQGLIPLYEDILSLKDYADFNALRETGALYLSLNSRVRQAWQVRLDPNHRPYIEDLIIGQQVRLIVDHHPIHTDEIVWIGKKNIVLDKEGQEKIDLELVSYVGYPII